MHPLPEAAIAGSVPALVRGHRLSTRLLQRYAEGARAAGLQVGTQRMRYDRRYAFQCLALTHAQGGDALRALSLQLFDLYQGS